MYGNSTRPLILNPVNSITIILKKLKSKVSSNIWLARQHKDPYVRKAIRDTYRARSAFKLIEIDDKYKILNPGDVVIDVGAAPGSWSQVAIKRTNSDGADTTKPQGIVISIDRSYIDPLKGAHLLSSCDITQDSTIQKVLKILDSKQVTHILSDMAPNASGLRTLDHDSIIDLQTKALDLAKKCLKTNGTFLCKVWYGEQHLKFIDVLKQNFETVKTCKPDASRTESAECFLLAQNFFNSPNKIK